MLHEFLLRYMMNKLGTIKNTFKQKKIKITPQRIAVYYAVEALGHASAEEVFAEVMKMHPTITIATIYNTLECLANNNIISRVMTQGNKMLFDIRTADHHHLYSPTDHKIQDFEDPELTELIQDYIKSKNIEDFEINEIKIQLIGVFKNKYKK